MVDRRLSPAARHALAVSSTGGRTDVVKLMTGLTKRPDQGAAKVLGCLSIGLDWFEEWLDDQRRAAAWELATEDVVAAQRQLSAASGAPATTGGVLIGLIGGDDTAAAGLPGTLRRSFAIYDADVAETAMTMRDAAVEEMVCLLDAPSITATPLPAFPDPVRVPYTILLEETLDRAQLIASNRGETNISSGAVMAATHSLFMTADLRGFYQAVGYSAVLLGGETPRRSTEAPDWTVELVGPDPSRRYQVSTATAKVLWTAAILGGVARREFISPELLILAQVATRDSRLGELLGERMAPGVLTTELYAHWAELAGLTAEQVRVASTICAAGIAGSPTEKFDDVTVDVLADAVAKRLLRRPPASGRGLTRDLRRAMTILHPELHEASLRVVEALEGAETSIGGSWSGELHGVGRLLRRWLEGVEPPTKPLLNALRSCLRGPDGAAPCGAVSALREAAATARGAPGVEPAARLYEAKAALQQIQADEPAGQRWAAAMTAPWPAVAALLGTARSWERAAAAVTMGARVAARSAIKASVPRWTPRFPALELVERDVAECAGQLLFVAASDDAAVSVHRDATQRWTGTTSWRPVGDELNRWWPTWDETLRAGGDLHPVLKALPAIFDVDVATLEAGRVEIVVDGLAAAVPLAQAIYAASNGEVRPVVHVLGGVSSRTSRSATLGAARDFCLVEEPPAAGAALRFANIETATLRSRLRPATVLAGTRAARSWVQRVLTAATRVPSPDVMHFVGHGTFDELPNGDLAASMILADGQRLTGNDIARVNSGIGTIICSACDLGVLGAQLGAASPPWPLAAVRAGVANVVAAAWPVDDAATVLLMTRLHEEWSESVDLFDALHAAALWLRDAGTETLEDYAAGLDGDNVNELRERIVSHDERTCADRRLTPYADAAAWAPFALYVS